MSKSWKVRVEGDGEVSALHERSTSDDAVATFVCAHGAGGNMNDRAMQAVAKELRSRGLDVVRFNFPYSEKKSGRPDAMPLLRATIEAVMSEVEHQGKLLIGGRSMGGRAASMLAADQIQCDGLLLLAYPLHPVGKPEQLRDAHLPSLTMPTLCFNGTRDTFCRRDLMEAVLPRLHPTFSMHWLDGADHSFHVLKSSGRTDAEVMAEMGSATRRWLDES